MAARLQAIVDRIRRQSSGVVNVDLARLNLRTGKPLSRLAMEIPDDPALVAHAETVCREILSANQGAKR
jgi:hypothetical protein